MNNFQLTWDSNPFAYGAIHLRIQGRKSDVGSISLVGERVRGYYLSEQIYDGDSEKEAMEAVEAALKSTPEHLLKGLLD